MSDHYIESLNEEPDFELEERENPSFHSCSRDLYTWIGGCAPFF